jgi:hypothetical protein
MLFLFNDVLLDIGQPAEVIMSPEFPMSPAAFSNLKLGEISQLAREEVFKDLQLPRTQPKTAAHLGVLLAGKTGANAALIGPPAEGARRASEFGLRLAEVSLMTLSHLYQLQEGGTLQPYHVQQAVWQALQS